MASLVRRAGDGAGSASAKLAWYWRRAQRMDTRELAARGRDHIAKIRLGWEGERIAARGARMGPARFASPFPEVLETWAAPATTSLLHAADVLLSGHLQVFDQTRDDLRGGFDWFLDPRSGLRAPSVPRFHRINHRSWPGSAKHVWEPSRHQHLTVLAAAAAATSDESYLDLIEEQLVSWWEANPPFRGFHWTSGIEIGVRLISWVWTRRLLAGFGSAERIFDENPDFVAQLYAHQAWLARLPSHGSSSNNHAVAESAGLFAASCAFPAFPESEQWRDRAARDLHQQMRQQVTTAGVHKELSPDYHAFVTELFLLAGLEGEMARVSLGQDYWKTLRSLLDALASMCDSQLRPPRQNDSDDALGLQVDGYDFQRVRSLLGTGRALFDEPGWWPEDESESVRTRCLLALTRPAPLPSAAGRDRIDFFPDAGMAILRSPSQSDFGEIWCKCDAGPLGYLKTAAHGHADALSTELRHDGVEVFADPGTYCYQHEAEWREYFRSTAAHNTLEVVGSPQARSDGPFIWKRLGSSRTVEVTADDGAITGWIGEFVHGEETSGMRQRRRVVLDDGSVEITDTVGGNAEVALRFHLGPEVSCTLEGAMASLDWPTLKERGLSATIDLPDGLAWRAYEGSVRPRLGWYSPAFGVRIPSVTLEGRGSVSTSDELVTRLSLRFV